MEAAERHPVPAPRKPGTLKAMRTAYIGMGANLDSAAGPPPATLAAAALRMGALGRIAARSRLYSTAPVGVADQPRFVNAVVALETELPARDLLRALLAIEREFGRNRATEIRNGPRTLDLDILLLGDEMVLEPDLEIPHPRLFERAFALIPLAELAPYFRDPRTGITVSQLTQRLVPGPPYANTSIFPFESDVWRPGADCGAAGRGPA
jgi:2-amino-4-hydroxy-6-hydroxymethyldihydropteridine diphosphokinase